MTGSSEGSGTSSSPSGAAAPSFPSSPSEQPIDLGLGKAEKLEVEAVLLEPCELGRQHRLVPAAIERDLVVGEPVGPGLRVAQMLEADHRHLGQAKPPRRQKPAVAGDQHAALVDQARDVEAELGDRGRDLRHLPVGVRAGVGGIGQQPLERPALDGLGQSGRHDGGR